MHLYRIHAGTTYIQCARHLAVVIAVCRNQGTLSRASQRDPPFSRFIDLGARQDLVVPAPPQPSRFLPAWGAVAWSVWWGDAVFFAELDDNSDGLCSGLVNPIGGDMSWMQYH